MGAVRDDITYTGQLTSEHVCDHEWISNDARALTGPQQQTHFSSSEIPPNFTWRYLKSKYFHLTSLQINDFHMTSLEISDFHMTSF